MFVYVILLHLTGAGSSADLVTNLVSPQSYSQTSVIGLVRNYIIRVIELWLQLTLLVSKGEFRVIVS